MKILIDYSCMSKTWLAAIIQYFIGHELIIEDTTIFFSYTPSSFDPPKDADLQQRPLILPDFFKTKGKPIAVIIGLGYEKLIRETVINSVKDFTNYVFYSNPAFDNRFVEEVFKNNKILWKIDQGKVFSYPINDLKKTDTLLTSICLELRLNNRVVLISLGPKPFTLSCLLLSIRYPDIIFWNISSVSKSNFYNRVPIGEPLICKTHFSCIEE